MLEAWAEPSEVTSTAVPLGRVTTVVVVEAVVVVVGADVVVDGCVGASAVSVVPSPPTGRLNGCPVARSVSAKDWTGAGAGATTLVFSGAKPGQA